jgi:hypothetical protein
VSADRADRDLERVVEVVLERDIVCVASRVEVFELCKRVRLNDMKRSIYSALLIWIRV